MVKPALTQLNASMKISREFVVLDLVVFELERRYAPADANFHAPVAEMVENANLLDQAQRRIERQQVDQGT